MIMNILNIDYQLQRDHGRSESDAGWLREVDQEQDGLHPGRSHQEWSSSDLLPWQSQVVRGAGDWAPLTSEIFLSHHSQDWAGEFEKKNIFFFIILLFLLVLFQTILLFQISGFAILIDRRNGSWQELQSVFHKIVSLFPGTIKEVFLLYTYPSGIQGMDLWHLHEYFLCF